MVFICVYLHIQTTKLQSTVHLQYCRFSSIIGQLAKKEKSSWPAVFLFVSSYELKPLDACLSRTIQIIYNAPYRNMACTFQKRSRKLFSAARGSSWIVVLIFMTPCPSNKHTRAQWEEKKEAECAHWEPFKTVVCAYIVGLFWSVYSSVCMCVFTSELVHQSLLGRGRTVKPVDSYDRSKWSLLFQYFIVNTAWGCKEDSAHVRKVKTQAGAWKHENVLVHQTATLLSQWFLKNRRSPDDWVSSFWACSKGQHSIKILKLSHLTHYIFFTPLRFCKSNLCILSFEIILSQSQRYFEQIEENHPHRKRS